VKGDSFTGAVMRIVARLAVYEARITTQAKKKPIEISCVETLFGSMFPPPPVKVPKVS
jgi:hypothetical protein